MQEQFKSENQAPEEKPARFCLATGCTCKPVVNGRCQFHNHFPYQVSGYVTRKLNRPEIRAEVDGKAYQLTYAQAAQENRVLWALDVFNEFARLGEVVYPVRDIAYREYVALWRAGLIPDEVKSVVNDHASLFEAMLMQFGHKIKLVNETCFFCTDWLCATYEQYLIDEVAKSVPADIPTEKPSVAEEMGVML